jgi:transposase-like protein
MAENNLNKPHFQDADKAREYLEALRWPNGPVCPHCGSIGGHYHLEGKATRPGVWKCKDCREQFTVTVGTVFERSKIKLNVWLQAVYWICTSKKGVSSHQLHRMLGVTYKTAWFMSHRIREAMKDHGGLLGGGGNVVEADETYWGNNKKRGDSKKGRGYAHKMKVFALVERDGKARGFQVPNVQAVTLKDILKKNVHQNTRLMTDEAFMYTKVGREFRSHGVVNHKSGEYSRGDAHTNTIEGYFSLLKRGLVGTFHHVGEQHLHRYVNEFDFRYNNRKVSDAERTVEALKQIGGKRLTYRRTGQDA